MRLVVRLLIVGNSGSGKSTYAARTEAKHGLARLELDSIVWEPHKVAVARPADDVRADLETFLASRDLFLNPGVAVCLENNRRRPWEPHKYDSPEQQTQKLPYLLSWVEEYYTREDPRSYAFHRRLFDDYEGRKREVTFLSSPVLGAELTARVPGESSHGSHR
jgi:ABC-type glutathione transport system ATPase component